MLLTKTQKRILELVREYGGMKAEMLERLCGGSHRFDVVLRQLEMNRMLFKMGEYYCDDSKIICGRDRNGRYNRSGIAIRRIRIYPGI